MSVARIPSEGASQVAPSSPIRYRTTQVDGSTVFYREAGPPTAPTLLLLHGFPSSSRMYEPLLARLAGRYHLVAPDFPGFGHSDAPDRAEVAYTFDHLAAVTAHFTEALGIARYSLYVQDYGGPVGFRMALAHPERLDALVVQNAVTHEEGLGPAWQARRAFWRDRAGNEAAFRQTYFSLAATRERHVGSHPAPDTLDPDRWTDEFAFLQRTGEHDLQSDLFYDYRTNVASYPSWQAWLRARQPRTLVVWGRYDPSFLVAEVAAVRRDVPGAEAHVLDAGHFATFDAPDQVAALVGDFLDRSPALAG